MSLTKDEIWKVIDEHFNQQGFVRHQINSYHDFIFNVVPTIVEKSNSVEFCTEKSHKISIKFTNAYFGKPSHQESTDHCFQLYPNECRLRQITYEAPLYSDIVMKQQLWNDETQQYEKDQEWYFQNIIAHIPVMVRSDLCLLQKNNIQDAYENKECIYDQGGYFIINGGERVLVAQERIGNNRIYVFSIKNQITAEIRSISETTNKTVSLLSLNFTLDKYTNEPIFYWHTPTLKKDIPFFTLFYAFEMFDHDQIYQLCGNDPEIIEMLRPSEEESFYIDSKDQAFNEIANRMTTTPRDEKKNFAVERFLSNEILPHVSNKPDINKTIYLGMMLQKLCLCLLKKIPIDDRDHFGFKRLDLASYLMGNIFRQSFQKMIKQMQSSFERKLDKKIDKNFLFVTEFSACSRIIGKDFSFCLSTGNWVINKQSKNIKTGVSQVMKRLAYMESLSYLRKVNAPIPKEGKNAKPRQLHNSQFGIICCAETPEGEDCGLIKYMSLTTDLSIKRDHNAIIELIQLSTPLQISNISTEPIQRVFVNGLMIGYCPMSFKIRDYLIDLRRSGIIAHDISVVYSMFENSIYVQTDAGRCIRPFFTLQNNQLQLTSQDVLAISKHECTWPDLINQGKIEYLDPLECENALIAGQMDQLEHTEEQYTHCEIHPAMIIGIAASIIPMANHNQSPRNTYESSMCKQSMSMYAMNFQYRFDTIAHVLCYPQKPLTPTKTMKYFAFEDMPAGHNVVAALACFTGYVS